MEHPNPTYRKRQADFLSQLPKEEQAYHARLFRIGNATYIYHQQTAMLPDSLLETYYKEWLEGLPAKISQDMKSHGFEACKVMLPFTRYVNERNDIGMRDWMKEHLSEDDFNHWQGLSEK